MDPERFDQFFFTIAKESGGIEGLFNSVFSFLFRRTDFFYESNPGDKMGFPPGVSSKMVNSILQQYQKEHYKRVPQKSPAEYQEKLKALKEKEESNKKLIEESKKQTDKEKIQNEKVETPTEEKKEVEPIVENVSSPINEKTTENTDISTYNGGTTEKYLWSQNISDVTVQINLPRKVRAKEMKAEIKTKSIKVSLEGEIIVEGELDERIKPEESFWSIEDETKLVLTLEKASENIWKTIFKGDTEIDTKKVDNSKPLQDFDSETQV